MRMPGFIGAAFASLVLCAAHADEPWPSKPVRGRISSGAITSRRNEYG